jgi:hypothetical protein
MTKSHQIHAFSGFNKCFAARLKKHTDAQKGLEEKETDDGYPYKKMGIPTW